MKITTTKEALAKACEATSNLAAKDAGRPYGTMLLDAAGNHLALTATDGNMLVTSRMDAEVYEEGHSELPGERFAAFVRPLNGTITVVSGKGKGMATLVDSNDTTFRLAQGGEMFTPMAGPGEDAPGVWMKENMLREMLRKVDFAACTDLTRRNLCGVDFRLSEGAMSLTATNGMLLAHVRVDDIDSTGKLFADFILPTKAVEKLEKLLDGADGRDVKIESDGKNVRFTGPDWMMLAKTVADKFPNWTAVVPSDIKKKMHVSRLELVDALKCAALATDDDYASTSIEYGITEVGITVKNAIAEYNAALLVTVTDDKESGKRSCQKFNAKTLVKILERVDDDLIKIDVAGLRMPITLRCAIPWLCVLMPLNEEQ